MKRFDSVWLLVALAACSGGAQVTPQGVSATSGTSANVSASSGTGGPAGVSGTPSAGTGTSVAAGTKAPAPSSGPAGMSAAAGIGASAGMTAAAGQSGTAGMPSAGATSAAGGGGAAPAGGTGSQPTAAGQSGSAAGAAGTAMPPASGMTCLQGSGDYLMNGPYKVKKKDVSIGSKGMYTIYYPDPLEANCPHPIVVWGNGTTITGGTAYDHFHNHAASWGIVTASSHNSNVGDGSFHKAGIDYLLAQNKEMGSEFFGKLSTLAGVSGHSQGGAGSDRSANHPNVKAIVNVQGSFGTPPMSTAALLCLTGTEDISPTGCPMAVKAAKVPAVCASWDGADHVSTTLGEGEGIEQYKRLYSAWFRCFLADDGKACAMFKGGADCPVCKEPGWEEIFANNY